MQEEALPFLTEYKYPNFKQNNTNLGIFKNLNISKRICLAIILRQRSYKRHSFTKGTLTANLRKRKKQIQIGVS